MPPGPGVETRPAARSNGIIDLVTALDDARNYINSRFGPAYRAWAALSDDEANRTLVSAADLLNHLAWQGTPTGVLNGDPTSLAWPRSGVVVDDVPIDSTTVPADVVAASFELAVLIRADPTLPGKIDQGTNLKSVGGAGVPTVEYFVPTSARTGTAPVLPVVILRLVGKYLASPAASAEGGFGQAGRCESAWSRHQQFTLIRGEE